MVHKTACIHWLQWSHDDQQSVTLKACKDIALQPKDSQVQRTTYGMQMYSLVRSTTSVPYLVRTSGALHVLTGVLYDSDQPLH